MTTPWYYDYYEPGKFPYQQKLCKALEWTSCNLEGQNLVPTVLIDSSGHTTETFKLTGQASNPLTLRLKALTKSHNKLKNELREINTSLNKAVNYIGMKGTFHTQKSNLKTEGSPVEEIEIEFDGYKIPKLYFYHHKVHHALFDYFVNLSCILDRLAYEISTLYEHGIWIEDRMDWNMITSSKNPKYMNSLIVKDIGLGTFIKEKAPNFIDVSSYRNRLVHDGVLKKDIENNGFPRKFHVYLPNKPNDPNSLNTIDALDYCTKLKNDVLLLLNNSYKLILKHIEDKGNPPW
jgi:hypothetical protein